MRTWIALVGLVPTMVGCVGQDPVAGSASLLDTCEGTYACTDGESDYSASLHAEADACSVDGVLLYPDGRVEAPGVDIDASRLSWQGDADMFEICVDGWSCLSCVAHTPRSTGSGSSGGACTGSPTWCDDLSPGSCSTVSGCYYHNHVSWDGSLEPECAGSADSCSTMPDESSCRRQGCSWH